MPRLRKLRRKQKFGYDVNRRRLNQKSKKLPRIQCDAIREAWDNRLSVQENLKGMGLVADSNADPKFIIPSGKQQMMPVDMIEKLNSSTPLPPSKSQVVRKLETEASEGFKSKKAIPHPLPKEMYKKLIGYLDLYGEDFDGMSRDHRNHLQETPAQLKSQINRLKGIPQQWIPYLKSRGLIHTSTTSTTDTEPLTTVTIPPKSQQ